MSGSDAKGSLSGGSIIDGALVSADLYDQVLEEQVEYPFVPAVDGKRLDCLWDSGKPWLGVRTVHMYVGILTLLSLKIALLINTVVILVFLEVRIIFRCS